MLCLFCERDGPFSTVEHVVPESLGNNDLVLAGHVCDGCQNYFGKEVERFVLEKTPIGLHRVLHGIRSKSGKLPQIDTSQPRADKGILPQIHASHDSGVRLFARERLGGTVEAEFENPEFLREVIDGSRRDLKFVFTPKVLEQMGRFLGKVALELLCLDDPTAARSAQFGALRRYVRHGVQRELWPLFHHPQGGEALVEVVGHSDEEVEVECYAYQVSMFVDRYIAFSFKTDRDVWTIPLDTQFPDADFVQAFPYGVVDVMWYPRTAWDRKPSASKPKQEG